MKSRSGISRKVVVSLVGVVLAQGLISMATALFIIWRASSVSLDDQMARTGHLVERYFNEAAETLAVKAELLAGHQLLIEDVRKRNVAALGQELTLLLAPLDIDAAVIADAGLKTVTTVGNRDLLGAANRANLLLSYNAAGRILFIPSGNRLFMWSLYPMRRGENVVGVLAVGINCDRAFVSRIEAFSNASLILSYRKSTMIGGHLTDADFLEYVRRAYSDPGLSEGGRIGSLSYRQHRFDSFKDLTAVYFLDNGPTEELIFQYLVSAAILLLVLLGVAVATAVWLYRLSFLKPFLSFQKAVRTIASGDLSFRAGNPGGDEFGELEREFEVMTSNLKKLEQELQLSSRMAAVGEMVAGVAHQIRNPLGVMKMSTDMLADFLTEEKDPSGRYRNLIAMMGDEIESLSGLIAHFLDFTRPLHVQREPTDVGKLIAHTVAMVPPEKKRGVALEACIEGDPLVRLLDGPLVQQILINLIVNALEASSPGQTVTVRAEAAQETGLVLTVADQGKGIAEVDQKNLFHPFFTTKPDGTGLGLSIVHRVVEGLGGTIEFHSDPLTGTVFTVRLGSEPG